MLEENLKDSGEIVQNILTQPLSISGASKEVSLLEAALTFDPERAMDSDLRKILLSFQDYPEETEMMLRELELLLDDLS